MGRWDRRRIPRRNYDNRKYRDYDYVEPPPSPPSPHHSQSNPPAIEDANGSSWEIEFCKSVGVRWKKVVIVNKFMHCHENIMKWDDSASKEAFYSAKQRYWEKINRLPMETPLEDPDKYNDEIDWNPHIDPELISELDRAYFNPDEGETRGKFYRKERNQVPELDLEQENAVSTTWGGQNSKKSKDSKDDEKENPWEQTSNTANEGSRNASWRGGCTDESWDCSNYKNRSWEDRSNNNNWMKKPNNGNPVYSGNNNWQRGGYTSRNNNGPWERDSKECVFEPYGSRNAFQSNCRKREGSSFQYPPRYKSSRFQGRGN